MIKTKAFRYPALCLTKRFIFKMNTFANNTQYDDLIEDPRLDLSLCTPINKNSNINFTNSFKLPYLNNERCNSNSSLASSISESNFPLNYKKKNSDSLSDVFVDLIMEIYQSISSDPTVTPFDPLNPPSGILNKVAKLSIEQSRQRQMDIGLVQPNSYLITLIRFRLSQELKREGYISRNCSVSSFPPPKRPQFHDLVMNSQLSGPFDFSLQQEPTLLKDTTTTRNNNGLYALTPNNSNSNLGYPSLNNFLLPRQLFRTASPLSNSIVPSNDSNLTAANISRHQQKYNDSNSIYKAERI